MISSFVSSAKASNMSNNQLVDHVLNSPIVSRTDAAIQLMQNGKLIVRGVIHGNFCDTNEAFELETRSTIYPASEDEKNGDRRNKWSLLIEMISSRIDDRKTVYVLTGDALTAVNKLDSSCNFGLCHQCRLRVCVYKEFIEDFTNIL